jgi:tetratricopeptide (TPR) repeat protein
MPLIDEIPQEIREAWPSNIDYLADLHDRLTGPHPIPLMPFVGAGLSMPMGFPSWTRFLKNLAGECGLSAEIATLLANGQYDEAADRIEQGLSPTLFNKRFTHTFGHRKSEARELKGPVLALPHLAAGAVVTTNFDRILERVFAEAGAPFEHVAWGSQVDQIRRAITENQPFLLKLHGDAEERTNRVLTRREYDTHYVSGNPEGLRAQISRVFQGRTLLFVGCSLGVDRTMDVLLEIVKQVSGVEHYAIIEKPASDPEFFERQRTLGTRGIQPIWYPTGRHDLIEPLLQWIARLQPSRRIPEPELVLVRPAQRRPPIRTELDLLIPYQRITDFVGRQREFAELQAWLSSDPSVAVRVVTGPGGSGKTRLATELIEYLAETQPDCWNCGFLTREEMDRFSSLQNLSRWHRHKPVLAVVDYAATSAEKLRPWLEQLAESASGGEKFRLLLLEREASIDRDWLDSAISRSYSSAAVRALFDHPEPMHLEPFAETVDRRSVLRATIQKGAEFLKVAAPNVPDQAVDVWFDQRIEVPQWGDPLTLMMAGLTALQNGLVEALSLGRRDLAFRLADRELDRVERYGNGAAPGLMRHMTAFVTVSGVLSRDELKLASRQESEAIGRHHPEGWAVLADRVSEALGGDGAKPIEPDVIGEALLLRVWGGAADAVLRAAKTRGQQVAAAVVRTAQDFSSGDAPNPEPLQWLDALIAEAKSNPPLLWQIVGALPEHTLVLRERAVEVMEAIAAVLDPGTGEEQSLRAGVLNNLGLRLSDLGRREDALQATNEAVGLYRKMAARRTDAFLPDLAMSLNNLGNRLSDLGRREEALQATVEAVRLYRQLAVQHPDAFLPDLAGSLSNLGAALSDLGRREEALKATEEAVGLYRQLAGHQPDAFLPDLAASLNNLGTMQRGLGRREEALQATEEAVSIRRQLAAQRPDAFLTDLASSLNNLGIRLSDLGRREEALQATEEAVSIYRQLAAYRPDAFLPDFAMSLNNLGTTLSDLARQEEALRATEEAVRLYRQLAAQRPDVFLPDLAPSLSNLGVRLSGLGRREEALQATEEAVGIRRQLAANRPDVFLPDLARSLNNLGGMLSDRGRRGEALKATEEAVGIRRQLAAQRPDAFLPDLAMSLLTKGTILTTRNPVEAISAFREGIECLKPLLPSLPVAFRQLMTSLAISYPCMKLRATV